MRKRKIYIVSFLMFLCFDALAQEPEVYSLSAAKAVQIKASLKENKQLAASVKKLTRQADVLIDMKFGSVMDKNILPPCGNKHEYMSMAKYYWPDTTKPGGVPYIRKDGKKNPANDRVSDDKNFDNLVSAVRKLSWSYYFTDDEKYAIKTAALLRMWFIDSATKMLPNLNHAQIRTGIDTGVSTGIIDTHNIFWVVDAVGLLQNSSYWKKKDNDAIKNWMKGYLQWLMISNNGKKEEQAKNNHGTYYDVQVLPIAYFLGEKEIVRKVLDRIVLRLSSQIEPDGKQPLELERTMALSYSTFNLQAWCSLALMAEKSKFDLWNYTTKDGRSIKKAIDFLLPYAIGDKSWTYQQINPYKQGDFYSVLMAASEKIKGADYSKAIVVIKESNKNDLIDIFY